MIPHTNHQTAPTRALTWEGERLAKRFGSILRGWGYRLWGGADNQRLVEDTFPQISDVFSSIERGVVKAKIARYVFLYVHGGFYFETEYKMLKSIGAAILSRPCVLPMSRKLGKDGMFRLGNAVLGSEPGHPFWRDRLKKPVLQPRALDDRGEPDRSDRRTGRSNGFYAAHRARYPDIYLPARHLFHPPPTLVDLPAGAYGVHLCFGSWRSTGLFRAFKALVTRKVDPIFLIARSESGDKPVIKPLNGQIRTTLLLNLCSILRRRLDHRLTCVL